MKKPSPFKLIFVFSLLVLSFYSHAQVGIGTNTPAASAKLEVSSSSKGFLPPRVTLTGTSDVTTIASPATALLVYNTATAGTSPNNVTPGFYYYDGSKWQRIINQQPDATVEFDKTTPTTSGVVFTPNTPASKDYVYVSTVDNSQWTYNGSAYVTYTPPASTAWYLSGGTSDAGSNKSGTIYRTGKVGIGVVSPTSKLEINSDTTNISGLRFTKLTSTTPTSGGATLGVDASGKVVTVAGSSFSPSFGSGSLTSAVTDYGSGTQLASVSLPTTGTYLINYTMRVQSTGAVANQWAVGYLSETSGGSVITGTEILGAYSATAFSTGGNYSGSYVVTVTSAPKSFYFMGRAFNGSMGFLEDGSGRTRITYVKVTP